MPIRVKEHLIHSSPKLFSQIAKILSYIGYRRWLPSFHPSVPSLIPLPHFWQTDRDRSGPDLDCSSSKRNWLCSPKQGETELEQIQKEQGDPDFRPEPICFQPFPLMLFPSSHCSLPKIESKLHYQHSWL